MQTTSVPLGLAALNKAIDQVGLSKLADELGVRYQLIQGWRDPSRRVAAPAEHCPAIERVTGGAIRCEDLRPDVDWAYLRGSVRVE